MKHRFRPLILLGWILLTGCSNTRFLAEGELLYTGRNKMEVTAIENGASISGVKPEIRSVTSHKVNNALFEKRVLPPVGLWIYNYRKPEEGRKIRNWLYRSLSAPPILVSDVKPELRAQKIENNLFDQGNFHAKAWSVIDTSSRNPRKARITYHVETGLPYRYNRIEIITPKVGLDTLIDLRTYREKIKPGDTYDLEKLASARNQIARSLQDQGYFYFRPEFIHLHADTTLGNHLMDLTVQRQADLPPEVLNRYRIDDITVRITRLTDTVGTRMDSLRYGDLLICYTGDYLRPEVLKKAVLFSRGELYSYRSYQQTISRLNNMGIFNSVRIYYGTSPEDSLRNLVDVRIDLVMAKNVNLDLEADLVMKSNDYIGPVIAVGLTHGNSFRGAERIHLRLNGGFELQWGSRQQGQIGSFSYEIGANAGITLPRILLPGPKTRIRTIARQQTSINQSYDLLNRTSFYKMLSARTELNYSWGNRREITHSFSPAYLNSIALLATTPAFDSVINDNIYIRKSFEEQFILGVRYEFTYDNSPLKRSRNLYFRESISTSGNLVDAFKLARHDPSERPFDLLGNIYSQHIKFTTEIRYYFNSANSSLATRLFAGIGIPYRNSNILPYVEQFFSGGAYSVRGFLARTVGPGTFHETENTYIDQSGDVRLEANAEYRFDMSRILKGAVFLDAGNIWLANEDENRSGSQFDINTFYRQLAVGTGVGLRFDFTFFVLRIDMGIPLRTPYLQDDRNWQFGTGHLFSNTKFYLAIGYPF